MVLQIARAYTPAPIARHQRSSTQLTSLLINNAGALEQYGFEPKQTTFLRAHSGFDVKHIEDVKKAVNNLVRDSDFDSIVQGRRMTIHFYSQMFDDILEASTV
ncbi:iron-containing redox enzyme family protein [Mycobacterium ulcerans]|uniref:iron-containing redox enzyme family protein n=1 Tax=Mycobacterium ulcerans TaxID=1809 RepID=UPI003B9682A6